MFTVDGARSRRVVGRVRRCKQVHTPKLKVSLVDGLVLMTSQTAVTELVPAAGVKAT